MQRLSTYIHELENWSNFTWRLEQLILPLSEVHILQGRILGKMEALGFQLQNEAVLETLIKALKSTDQVLKRVLSKADFWQKNNSFLLNERQKNQPYNPSQILRWTTTCTAECALGCFNSTIV
jgi:hypothetical protein